MSPLRQGGQRIARALVAAVIVIVATLAAVLMPPAYEPLAITSSLPAGVRGAFHIHTNRSDGAGTVDEVAAAAARAGLKFIIITDHGDGTREALAPAYRDGVLCIDALEISTQGGHLVALGLPRAPYPLGGEPRDVIEDVARLGGFSIAAHPTSLKPGLRWLDWTSPFDGIEWLNQDSDWRDDRWTTLVRTLFTYPLRAPESLARLLDRDEDVMRRWDVLTRRRRVVAVAAGDAHARLYLASAPDPYDDGAALRLPGYEQVFRTFSIVLPQVRLSGNAAEDAVRVLAEMRAGHVFSSIDALASPASLSFTAVSGSGQAAGGDVLPLAGPIAIRVASNAPQGARISLLRDGSPVAAADGATLTFMAPPEPAVYRAEIVLAKSPGMPPIPWIVTNPVYAGRDPKPETVPPRAPAVDESVQYGDGPATGWTIETAGRSAGAFDVARAETGTQVRWRWALGGIQGDPAYTAVAIPAGRALAGHDRLTFRARAEKPMRLSVQLRVPQGPQGERWQRSVYLDDTMRDISVFFDEMTPIGPTSRRRPVLADVQAILWVIEPVNTALGSSGTIWIDDVRYGR
jgi:hypothetical protein